MQSVPEGPLGRASTVASGVGQIRLNWNGANSVGWKVLDADRKTALRNLRTGAKGSDSQDLPPGDYVFALDATAFQPTPVTVRNGQASTVTPAVGQITLNWNGANSVGWKVLDADKRPPSEISGLERRVATAKIATRRLCLRAHATEFQPTPVTVHNGQASTVTPAVGQITLKWNGANSVGWKVLDADRKTALRNLRTERRVATAKICHPETMFSRSTPRGFSPFL